MEGFNSKHKTNVKQLVGIAILTAMVVVLQLLGQFIKFGPVSVSLVLLPIVIGSALYGAIAGAILGIAFGIVVLLQPDTAYFYGMSAFGTVIIVLLKGGLAGWLSGISYNLLAKKNTTLAVAVAAIVCPIVNTAIFFIGCLTFFYADLAKLSPNVITFVITTFIGFNFLFELLINVFCCPLALRLLRIAKRTMKK